MRLLYQKNNNQLKYVNSKNAIGQVVNDSIVSFDSMYAKNPTNAAEEIFFGNVISDNEVRIGNWINGKPLYRKFITHTEQLTNAYAGSSKSYSFMLTDFGIDTVYNVSYCVNGYIPDTSTLTSIGTNQSSTHKMRISNCPVVSNITYARSSSASRITFDIINIAPNSVNNGKENTKYKINAFIEYTKLSDSAEQQLNYPYYKTTETNTGEKWIDGKDIYCIAKYLTETAKSSSSVPYTFTVDNMSNVDSIIHVFSFFRTTSSASNIVYLDKSSNERFCNLSFNTENNTVYAYASSSSTIYETTFVMLYTIK